MVASHGNSIDKNMPLEAPPTRPSRVWMSAYTEAMPLVGGRIHSAARNAPSGLSAA